MSHSESTVQKQIMLAVSEQGCRIFRNNCGAYKTEDGRFVRYGVASPGGSDLIGWTSITITKEMIGTKVAIFTAIEVKSARGRASADQKHFINTVLDAGGISGIARSPQDAIDLLPKQ